MTRLFTALMLTALACVAAAVFGALHDQVSYGVAPDYYHMFKFDQFAIPRDWPPRLGAAWVGVQASWWMGLVIGVPVFGIGALVVPTAAGLRRAGFWAIALVLGLTALASATGLLVEIISPTPDGIWWTPDGADVTAFRRAGAMHNAAYLGGALGLLAGLVLVIVAGIRARRAA
ncbi:hypothetical protein [Jannaschia pohangensis]|uniref:DUF1772 domain-containing protein n=1 Tax=Jannaschia pohangensis TaxID=390807 RepID=A0A1I3UDS3_9RHOB|nr:hypothetical protein [Jannaschia pohangensis]SFJ80799.1 hypothetical protein SAMN04488095_3722 [Jannaschia pohangensis]